jgi:hypothetical protein
MVRRKWIRGGDKLVLEGKVMQVTPSVTPPAQALHGSPSRRGCDAAVNDDRASTRRGGDSVNMTFTGAPQAGLTIDSHTQCVHMHQVSLLLIIPVLQVTEVTRRYLAVNRTADRAYGVQGFLFAEEGCAAGYTGNLCMKVRGEGGALSRD